MFKVIMIIFLAIRHIMTFLGFTEFDRIVSKAISE